MPGPDADDWDAVEAHLQRLDSDALADLVADLWDARGYDTERSGTTVHAVLGEREVRIAVGTSSDAHEEITFLGADDVLEQLRYAVEPAEARALCRRHLGAPPAELSPPALARARRSLPPMRTLAVAAVLVTVLAGVTTLGLATLGGDSGGDTSGTRDSSQPQLASAASGAPTGSTSATGSVDPAELPPGVSNSGIENLSKLSAAHAGLLSASSYTIWRDVRWRTIENRSLVPVQRDVDVYTDGEQYLVESTTRQNSRRVDSVTIYHDGKQGYLVESGGSPTRYNGSEYFDRKFSLKASPQLLTSELVETRLSTPRTNVTSRVRQDGRTLYRIVGAGNPDWAAMTGAYNYSFVALVSEDGLVYDVNVSYRVRSGDRLVPISRQATYDRIGTTDVQKPAWYDEALRERETADDGA